MRQERQLREEAERWARELEAQLDKEMVLKSERERWFASLEAKLDEHEASRKELGRTLSFEREKVLRLEREQRVLNEIRQLLGAEEETRQFPGQESTSANVSSPDLELNEHRSFELLIETRHGRWVFRPPFALDEDEVELIRLVAGEDEMTAEQIKQRTGRRRASDDLDDLLDRLADEGLEPIKEVNDRYSFDPDFLQN